MGTKKNEERKERRKEEERKEGGREGRREGGRKENILNTFELNRFLSSRLSKLFNMLTSPVNI